MSIMPARIKRTTNGRAASESGRKSYPANIKCLNRNEDLCMRIISHIPILNLGLGSHCAHSLALTGPDSNRFLCEHCGGNQRQDPVRVPIVEKLLNFRPIAINCIMTSGRTFASDLQQEMPWNADLHSVFILAIPRLACPLACLGKGRGGERSDRRMRNWLQKTINAHSWSFLLVTGYSIAKDSPARRHRKAIILGIILLNRQDTQPRSSSAVASYLS